MEIFITVVVLAIVVLAVKYYLDHHKSKGVLVSEASVEEAPYKVEPPAEQVWPESAEAAALAKTAAAPELKVVSNAPKKSASPKPRAKKPAAKPAAKTTAPRPKKPRQPTQK